MPLPSDERIVALAEDILQQFDTLFGLHPGFRAAHAKGILLTGSFRPSPGASSLTRAPHVTSPSTPVIVRFSDSSGLPLIPDNNPNGNPKGMGIRFQLAEHVHTDIVSHGIDSFPTHTAAEFLEMLRAIGASATSKEDPLPIQQFLGSHPTALAFVQAPKPFPVSFATENYFSVTAYRFTNESGVSRYGRYRIVPVSGTHYLSDEDAAAQKESYLLDELVARIAKAPIEFRIMIQLADEGDTVDDSTVRWPETREQLELGTLSLTGTVPNDPVEQKQIIYDPIPRVDGIEPSADPLLEVRAAIYLLSGRRRRKAS